MPTLKRAVAAVELLLMFPATVFMSAILVRNVTPLPNEPAQSAQRLVMWFAHLPPRLGLWGLLTLMPLAVLLTGGTFLLRNWREDPQFRHLVGAIRANLATLVIAGATLSAGGVLAFVAVHMMTD
ncbi:MAG TPA: hypothetical protein VIX35_06575 [Vicinamibacterales bacterium]